MARRGTLDGAAAFEAWRMVSASGRVAPAAPEVVMRSAGIFHPQWGYLAPAHSFLRGARVIVVATAVGATAGAVVVVSLLERVGADADKSIAAHALVTSVPVAAPALVQSSVAPPAPALTGAPAQAAMAPQVQQGLANADAGPASGVSAPATKPTPQAADEDAAASDSKPVARARRPHGRRRHTASNAFSRRRHGAWRTRRWRNSVATARPRRFSYRAGASEDSSN